MLFVPASVFCHPSQFGLTISALEQGLSVLASESNGRR